LSQQPRRLYPNYRDRISIAGSNCRAIDLWFRLPHWRSDTMSSKVAEIPELGSEHAGAICEEIGARLAHGGHERHRRIRKRRYAERSRPKDALFRHCRQPGNHRPYNPRIHGRSPTKERCDQGGHGERHPICGVHQRLLGVFAGPRSMGLRAHARAPRFYGRPPERKGRVVDCLMRQPVCAG
jgi:hypothetical protein